MDIKLTRKQLNELWFLRKDRKIAYRAEIILLASEGYKPKDIAEIVELSKQNVIKWIKRFEEKGIKGLYDKKREGRKPKFKEEVRKKILRIIQKTPREYGIPVATWSIRLLKAFLEKQGIEISRARLHQIIREEGITWRKTRTEIKKKDKEYAKKKLRILKLIREKPPYSVVFFFDEKGPVGIKKFGGYSWIKKDCTKSVPINQKTKGKLCFFVAYDPHNDKIVCKAYERKTSMEFVDFLHYLSSKTKGTIYLILDNCPTHYAKRVKEALDRIKRIVFIPTAKYAPEMNWVERKLLDMQRQVFDNTEFESSEDMMRKVYEWVEWYNSGKGV